MASLSNRCLGSCTNLKKNTQLNQTEIWLLPIGLQLCGFPNTQTVCWSPAEKLFVGVQVMLSHLAAHFSNSLSFKVYTCQSWITGLECLLSKLGHQASEQQRWSRGVKTYRKAQDFHVFKEPMRKKHLVYIKTATSCIFIADLGYSGCTISVLPIHEC